MGNNESQDISKLTIVLKCGKNYSVLTLPILVNNNVNLPTLNPIVNEIYNTHISAKLVWILPNYVYQENGNFT